MGIDYSFYPKEAIGKNLDTFRKQRCSFEGYVFDNAEYLCKKFGLPEIPYYFCIDKHPYEFISSEVWFKRHEILNYYNNLILECSSCKWTDKKQKRYKSYCHWVNWGLEKLENITIDDIKNSPKFKGNEKEILINTLEDIKVGINGFLSLYKRNYYMISEV